MQVFFERHFGKLQMLLCKETERADTGAPFLADGGDGGLPTGEGDEGDGLLTRGG